MKSWIKLHRSIRDWGWYHDPITKSVYIELLLIANWKKAQWNGINLNVGDAVVGRRVLAERLGISEQNVRTALNHLELSGDIKRTSTNKYTIVHITDFEKYQNTKDKTKESTTEKEEQPLRYSYGVIL